MYAPQFSLRPAGPQKQVQVSHAAGKAAQPQTPESLVQVASQTHEGVDHRSMLGKLKVQFGVYKGKTFSWLLNNDRDYMVKVLASHEVEQECDKSTTLLQRYKDVLLRYARLFPEVTAAISAKRRAEMEAMGHRMVGFGTYSSLTYRELYESREQKIRSYRNLIRRLRVRNVNSQFSKLKQYILSMDMDCTPAPSTSCSLMCTTNADVQSNTTLRILSVSSLSPQCQDTNLGSATVPYASSTTPGPPSHPTAQVGGVISKQNQMFPLESFRISLPPEQREWLSTVLFSTGATGKCVLSEQLQLWYNPPGPSRTYSQRPTSPNDFFQRRFFLWAPVRMWHYRLKCPSCSHNLTSCSLYKTVHRVLDLDGWYYMGTEYLECMFCGKKLAAWCRSVREQLELGHQILFPAVLTYRLWCDKRVLSQMTGPSPWRRAKQLCSFLDESHREDWTARCLLYLQTCLQFESPGARLPPPPDPPNMQPVPINGHLLSAYARDTFNRMEELQAGVTSIFGSVLKIKSTEVTKRLAGSDSVMSQWMSSVGNELGQVLICILTAAEGSGLQDMTRGLQNRYSQTGHSPPEVLYVDRGCCWEEREAAAGLFSSWPQLQVRLDPWHFIRRLASGVTTESHPLYTDFMRQISASIFMWDQQEVSRLRTAKQAERSRWSSVFTTKEMALHCRRHTRGAEETLRLLTETIEAFMGVTDSMNNPLLDKERMENIWRLEKKHVACLQDPPGTQLYSRIGQLTKGGVDLPIYRCARGCKSLESFYVYLDRFIPDTSANDCHFQMYLLQALTRWNQDQTRVAAGEGSTMGMSSTELKKQKLNQLRQHLLGETLPETTKPLLYTGELMGINYLYSQTGRKLHAFPDDPEEPDCSEIKLPDEVMSEEDWPLNVLHKDVDEGFDEVTEACFNPLFKPSLLQQSSAPQKPPVSDSQLEPVQEAPGLQEEAVGPDVAPGYQHVVRLAQRLIMFARKGYITNVEVEEIIHLWMNLSEDDKRPVACPSKEKDSPTRGRGRSPAASCVTGTDGTMSLLPDASRLVEAIFKELSILHPTLQRIMGVVIYRWSLVLRHYNSIRNVVMSHPTLRSRTTLNLFAINQVTAAQWHKRFMPRDKMTTPVVAVAPLEVTVTSVESSPVGQEPKMDSRIFSVNQNLLVSAKDPEVAPSHTSPAPAPSTSISMVGDAEVPDFTTHTPQSTASKKKARLPEVEVAAKWGQMLKVKSVCINFCRSCGDRKIKETGHRILRIADGKRLNYCPREAKGKSPEEWLASLRL